MFRGHLSALGKQFRSVVRVGSFRTDASETLKVISLEEVVSRLNRPLVRFVPPPCCLKLFTVISEWLKHCS